MALPSYRKRLMMFKEILTDGSKLFKMLRESEEQLQEQLLTGDHRSLTEAEENRSLLRKKIAALEERRKELVPDNMGMQKYIRTMVPKSSQGEMITHLEKVLEELKQIKVVHEVNRSLLEERLRFSKEIRETLLSPKITYDERGQLTKSPVRPIQNLDRNC